MSEIVCEDCDTESEDLLYLTLVNSHGEERTVCEDCAKDLGFPVPPIIRHQAEMHRRQLLSQGNGNVTKIVGHG